MTAPITPREIQRWYPRRWDEIVGNSPIVQVWKNFIEHGGINLLLTGPSRSGKTRSIALGIMATLCPHRSEKLDPCGVCESCKQLVNARESVNGLFSLMAESHGSFFAVDCESVSTEDLKTLVRDVHEEFGTKYVFLDEVAALGRRGLDGLLLKAIDETPAIWIASAITVRRQDGKKTRTHGLSDPMLARFAEKVGTTLPREPELTAWIKARCGEWEIAIEQEAKTLPLLIKRSRHRVGMVLLVLAVAASRGRKLTFDDVQGFDFQSPD